MLGRHARKAARDVDLECADVGGLLSEPRTGVAGPQHRIHIEALPDARHQAGERSEERQGSRVESRLAG